MIYVVALNYQQFTYYVQTKLKRSKYDKELVFVATGHSNSTLRGHRITEDDTVVKVGEYANGKYLLEVLTDLELCRV